MRAESKVRTAHAPPRMHASNRHVVRMRPLGERREVVVSIWAKIQRRDWMTEEAARGRRRRSLLQDNPASG